MKKNKVIGLTIGDPAGIGPEIIQKTLRYFSKRKNHFQLRVIGSTEKMRAGKPSRESAALALAALEESVKLLKKSEIDAVVNAPVCKANLNEIGFHFPGQTEFYAARAGLASSDVTMMLTCSKLTVSLVTTHCSLREAIERLSIQKIIQTTLRTIEIFKKMGVQKPKIAVCGLNPHAGENGLFGDEEKKHISLAISYLQKNSDAQITGPHPPDAVFRQVVESSKTKNPTHSVICMYHDQGLIPLKLIGFDEGVNVTLGLPFLRAAPNHGTAFDIAGKKIASPKSLISAIHFVAKNI